MTGCTVADLVCAEIEVLNGSGRPLLDLGRLLGYW
jgi:hypothetical protein